jgi:hypothetical protein
MISELFHRRRAERFAQLLDQADSGRGRHSRSALDDKLVAELLVSQRLCTMEVTPAADPTPRYRADLRALLMAEAELASAERAVAECATMEMPAVAPAQRRPVAGRIYADASPGSSTNRSRPAVAASAGTGPARRRRLPGTRRTRIAILAGFAAGTLALSGISMASGDALPGDPLYAMKRSAENAQLVLAVSDVDKGQAYLNFARTRGQEATATRSDPGKLLPVLGDLDQQTTTGVRLLADAALNRHDAAILDSVDGFVTEQRPALTNLLRTVSGPDRPRAQQSLDLLTQIAARSAALRATIDCPSSGRSDALGPLPPDCTGH